MLNARSDPFPTLARPPQTLASVEETANFLYSNLLVADEG